MKTKLYKKFVKLVCKILGISRKQLFSREFHNYVVQCSKFELITKKIVEDPMALHIIRNIHPLYDAWQAWDFHVAWFFKYWQYSNWKAYVQIQLDLGIKEDDILIDILTNKRKSKRKN